MAVWVGAVMGVARPGHHGGLRPPAWGAAGGGAQPAWLQNSLRRDFVSAAASNDDIISTIEGVISGGGYAFCPHTACGAFAAGKVAEVAEAAAAGRAVLFATAHPAKFEEETPPLQGVSRGRGKPAMPMQLLELGGRTTRCMRLARAEAAEVMGLVDQILGVVPVAGS